MLPWTLKEVAALTGGRLLDEGAHGRVAGVKHDTRQVEKGDLFTAIVGKRLDGHRFVKLAARQGAKAALVNRRVHGVSIPQILVKDTTRALGELGRSQRLQWNKKVVAVTGSVGKTTVKDMTAHLLQGSYKVLKSEGNLNNQFGLPLTLLRLEGAHEAAVVELGINHPGEMQWLSEIARPDVAVVTSVGEAHLGFFRDRAHLAREKMKIASELRGGGIRIVNAENKMLNDGEKNTVTFGLKLGQVKAVDIRTGNLATQFTLQAQGERVSARLGMPGIYNVQNSLAAVSAGLALGIPLKTLAKRLSRFVFKESMRMEMRNLKGVLFINDAYNASTTSMEAALDTFQGMKGVKRKTAVLGDMMEMGAFSLEAHQRVARKACEAPLDAVVLVGKQMMRAFQTLPEECAQRACCFETVEPAARHLADWVQKGDAVLLKASRAMKLEKVLDRF